MRWRNTADDWGLPAKSLHWAVALLVLAEIALGWAAASWRLSPVKLDLFVWHKSTGMLILALTLVRLAWRLANDVPSPPPATPPLERLAARVGHVVLYLLLLLLPMTGWILNSAANVPLRLFWLVPLPPVVGPDEALADLAARGHLALFVVLGLLLVVHVGAALRHHFWQRDDVLLRMLFRAGNAR